VRGPLAQGEGAVLLFGPAYGVRSREREAARCTEPGAGASITRGRAFGNHLLGPVRESFALKSHSIRLRRDADPYSDFGVQRMLEGFGFSKPEEKFSATGRGLKVANNAAKCEKNGILTVTYLTLMTCWRRMQSRANPSPP